MKYADIKKFPFGGMATTIDLNNIEDCFIGLFDLEVEPDFQRGHVWTEDQQVAFMEHLLREGHTPPLIINDYGWIDNNTPRGVVLVDGLQRLTAARRFVAGEIKAYGHYIHEYEDSRILKRRAQLTYHKLRIESRDEVLQLYVDLNVGGVVHTDEEIARVKALIGKEA